MNGPRPTIEIIKPFSDAIELTRIILFRPFDLAEWCVIGFAAFLAHLSGNGFFNFGNWHGSRSSSEPYPWEQWSAWVLVLIAGLIVVALIVMVVFWWIGCRGRFIFTDCIVRNRAAIAEPWRNYAREGNSLFLYMLVSIIIFLVCFGLGAVPVILLWVNTQTDGFSVPGLIALLVIAPLFLMVIIAWTIALYFMVPIMYRQRCGALSALNKVGALVRNYPAEIILCILFLVLLGMASGIIVLVAMCATCCIVLIPYVGTVILLPLFVFYYGYLLLFLRQFGSEYDVWAGASPLAVPVAIAPPEQRPPSPEPN